MIYVQDMEELKRVASDMAKAPRLAVDTEADSLHHYREKLCLLQVSTPEEDFVIDPLVPLDLGDLLKRIETRPLIFHGADFDLRILKRFYRFEPKEIFDTMIAAQFLGYERPSLAVLSEKHCGVKLPKANQKADWSKRPLNESMLVYAGNDVHYLHPIAGQLESELRARGRIHWVGETCRELLKIVEKKPDQDRERAWRVKGSHELEDRELVILKELWQWREDEARGRDRPPFKVLNPEYLVSLARWAHRHPGRSTEGMPNLPRQIKHAMAQSVDKVIRRAARLPLDTILSVAPRRGAKRLSRKEERELDALKGARNVLAREYGCYPGVLVSNAILESLVRDRVQNLEETRSAGHLMAWQMEVVGRRFLEVLQEMRKESEAAG